MIEMLSGASGMSTAERCTRCAPESCHSIVARASPGHGGPSGGLASRAHSPTSGSSRLSASSAVGWSITALLPLVGSCKLHARRQPRITAFVTYSCSDDALGGTHRRRTFCPVGVSYLPDEF